MAGVADLNIGDEIKADVFAEGDYVDVSGTSKGKGFAGVVKRYHWHGGDMTHGSMIHRKPQSAGATGIVLTKLDGTAKGGIAVAIARELDLPVRFVGVGEKMSDLLEFSPEAFVDALLG